MQKICFYLSATTFANWAIIRVSPMIRYGTSAGERADWMSATVDASSKIRAACARTATSMIDVLNTMTKIILVAKIISIEINFIFTERKLQSTSTLFCQKFRNSIFYSQIKWTGALPSFFSFRSGNFQLCLGARLPIFGHSLKYVSRDYQVISWGWNDVEIG